MGEIIDEILESNYKKVFISEHLADDIFMNGNQMSVKGKTRPLENYPIGNIGGTEIWVNPDIKDSDNIYDENGNQI